MESTKVRKLYELCYIKYIFTTLIKSANQNGMASNEIKLTDQ